MPNRFKWTEPKLCSYSNDISKDWFVYFTYTDQLTGRTIRKQFRGIINNSKNKVERLANGKALIAYWKKQLKSGWNPFGKEDLPIIKPTLIEALKVIIELKTASCGKRALERYTYISKLFCEWLDKNRLENIYVYQFDHNYARSYMDFLTLKKEYANRTWNDHLSILTTLFNSMMEREWIPKNPFKGIKKLPVEIGRNIAFSADEKERLGNYLKKVDKEMYYFTQFVYYCFIRRSELTRLKIENIDWVNMSIIIPANASKNKKQESVVVPNVFVELLRQIGLQNMPPDWYIFGRKLKPGPTQYKNYNHISTRHNLISKQLGIDTDKGLYSWKHTGVCELYKVLNGDMYSLMRQLRHSELTTTQIYLKSLGLIDNTAIRSAVW